MKLSKLTSLLFVSFFTISCSPTIGPTILSVDLSDAECLFFCNNCTHGYEADKNNEGAEKYMFHLYKTDANGVTKRVKIKTRKSDDDEFFKTKNFVADDLIDISKQYFYAEFDNDELFEKDRYFINKQTGEAFPMLGDYVFPDIRFPSYTSAKSYLQEDKDGNIYTCAYNREKKTYQIVMFAEKDNKIQRKEIYDVDFDLGNVRYAVDSGGNVMCADVLDGSKFSYITKDGEIIKLSSDETNSTSRKLLWTGYDGNIYWLREGHVEKVTYDKQNNSVETEQIAFYENLNGATLNADDFIFLDDAKKIYYATLKDYENVTFYQLYGDGITSEKITFDANTLFPSGRWGKNKVSGLGASNIHADGSYIYVIIQDTKDDESEKLSTFEVAKIDVNNNMIIARTSFQVSCIDALRILANGKMALFYWNKDNKINIPTGDGIYMSIGIFDTNTGVLTPQDRFISGNANRSHIIYL